jgi:hypothetical protein
MSRLDRIFGRYFSLLALCIVAAPTAILAESPTVALTLASGRTIQADRITRSNDDGLVVRAGSSNAFVERHIPWASISQAAVIGSPLSIDELKAFSKMVAPMISEPEPLQASRVVVDRAVRKAVHHPQENRSVAGVVADAWLGQSNPSKLSEALQVRISAIDHDGNPVAVDATAELRFVVAAAENYVRDSGAIGHSPVELGRWTKALSRQANPAGTGAWRLDIPRAGAGGSAYGMLVVRLIVPGSGVFETIVDGVRRRNFRPVQDALRGDGGVRTLP